jgi:hypothetical protein
MSGANTQRAETPEDFGKDKAGIAARWIAELRLADQDSQKWRDRGKQILKRYMDDRDSSSTGTTRFNVLWSNVETLKPAVYATAPKPVVQRRYLDADPVARAASTILQRAIQTMIETTGWHEVTDQCVMDYLLPGRGTAWARYEPHFEDVAAPEVAAMEAAEDGMQAAADMPGAMPENLESDGEDQESPAEEMADDGAQITNNAEGQEITYEEVCWDYVHWQDFRHSPARTWQEVRWVAREVLMTRDEGIERFGEVFRSVPMTWHPSGMEKDDPAFQLFTRARVFEIWDKPSRKVFWVCPDFGEECLDEKDDFLKLNDFFPCPRPLYATLSNGSLMPAADFKMYQDQANELDELTARMAEIARDIKVAGIYDASNNGLERLLSEGHENKLIPVEGMAMFQQSGGMKGAIEWLPLESMVVALGQLTEAREVTKRDLYEITGIADIVRGQGAATATATAERLKGQFAQLRLRDRVGRVARFCRDQVRITGEIIAKHFQPQTLLLLSDYQQTTGASPEMAMQAIQLLKNDQLRGFRVEIEVDSTVVADQEQEQAGRVAFLQMAGKFLAEAVPLAQQVPELANLAGQMLLFGIRGFPVGREMESVFETALEQLQQAGSQPKPEPPPDPAIVKAQMDAQTSQQEIALRAQEMQMTAAVEAQKNEQMAAIEALKAQIKQAEIDLANRKQEFEERRAAEEGRRADADQLLRSEDVAMKGREARMEREFADVSAVQEAMAMLAQQIDKIGTRVEDAHKAATSPRRVTIERGPDGRAIGARQELEGL